MIEKERKEKVVRLKWGEPDDAPPIYANHFYVTHSSENEFHLVFGYFMPPLTIGLEEDELPDSVEIKPVARMVISPEFMGKIVDAINENFSKYKDKKGMKNE